MNITSADVEALRKELTVNAAVAEGVNAVPFLQSLRGASNLDDSGAGGFYDADDIYTGYWLAGDEVESAPLKEE